MQKEQDTQFRFTPQVGIILAVTFIAMIVPIACMVIAAHYYFEKPAPAADPAAFAPLQKALEDVADKNFEKKITLTLDDVVTLTVADPSAAEKKIQDRVAALGGVAMRSNSEAGEGTVHLLVQLPENRIETFKSSPLQASPEEKTSPGQGDDQARTLVEVLIKKETE